MLFLFKSLENTFKILINAIYLLWTAELFITFAKNIFLPSLLDKSIFCQKVRQFYEFVYKVNYNNKNNFFPLLTYLNNDIFGLMKSASKKANTH